VPHVATRDVLPAADRVTPDLTPRRTPSDDRARNETKRRKLAKHSERRFDERRDEPVAVAQTDDVVTAGQVEDA
jgi:hypothetical protein